MSSHTIWSREELILVFNLYLKLPFGKMHKGTPEIIGMAKLLGRTPSSIAMRLSNFASCDPQLQARGVSGLRGGMNQVRPIWDEFYEHQEDLVFESERILAEKEESNLETKYKDLLSDIKDLQGETALCLVKTRVNQHVFRTMVLNNHNSRCCITGFDIPDLLIASHIEPWNANANERLNPHNGLCLNALMDIAFDRGLITVTSEFKVKISPYIEQKSQGIVSTYFEQYEHAEIQIPKKFKPSQDFLNYHYQHIFRN